jgi:hypothetical protein
LWGSNPGADRNADSLTILGRKTERLIDEAPIVAAALWLDNIPGSSQPNGINEWILPLHGARQISDALSDGVSIGKPSDASRIWLWSLGKGFSWGRKQPGSANQRAEQSRHSERSPSNLSSDVRRSKRNRGCQIFMNIIHTLVPSKRLRAERRPAVELHTPRKQHLPSQPRKRPVQESSLYGSCFHKYYTLLNIYEHYSYVLMTFRLLALLTEVLTIPPPRLPLTVVPMRFQVPMSPMKVMLATAPSKEELPLS